MGGEPRPTRPVTCARLHRLGPGGIGSALINEGLSSLRALGARGYALVGDPHYYVRLGFRNLPGLVYAGIPQEYFQVLPLGGEVPKGIAVFHDAFLATG